jgi:hypothetical protein
MAQSKPALTNSISFYLTRRRSNKFLTFRLHYPFTLLMGDHWEKDKLVEAIRKMKEQLEELRLEKVDKSQSSFSVMSDTYGQG